MAFEKTRRESAGPKDGAASAPAASWTALREHETATLRLRNRAAEIARSIEPKSNCFLGVFESDRVRAAMGHTTGKLWHVGNKRLIFVAPEDDDLVPVFHGHFSAKLYFKMTARSCFTWYGLAFAPSRWMLICSSMPDFPNM